jgi:prepilin-type processing-associated H-X9-DG protein
VQHRQDNGPTLFWFDVIQPYVMNEQIIICPSAKNSDPGYGWNYPHAGYRLDLGHQLFIGDIEKPAEMMIFGDSNPGSYRYYLYCGPHWPTGIRDDTNVVGTRHNEGANFAFADGHGKWFRTSAILGTSDQAQRFWGHPSPSNTP